MGRSVSKSVGISVGVGVREGVDMSESVGQKYNVEFELGAWSVELEQNL